LRLAVRAPTPREHVLGMRLVHSDCSRNIECPSEAMQDMRETLDIATAEVGG
jgi:hypothetical protein